MSENGGNNAENSSGNESLRRGNINFDLLKPEGSFQDEYAADSKVPSDTVSKRGQFDRARKANPVGKVQIFFWTVLFTVSLFSFTAILLFGHSLLWMISLPFIFTVLLWSMIMLALFKARPR